MKLVIIRIDGMPIDRDYYTIEKIEELSNKGFAIEEIKNN